MKLHLLLGLSFLSFFTFSCEQEELLSSPTTASATHAADATVSTTGRPNLLAEAIFEPALSAPFRTQVFTSYGLTMNSTVVRNGATAARFEMRKGDGKIRSEILLTPETHSNRWYSNSIYLPSEYWATDMDPDNWDILTQWHALDDPGEGARVPPLSLNVSKGRLSFTIYWATQAINTNTTVSGKKVFDLGPVEKDKWLDMVYHMNFSHTSTGVLEVWKNGVKVIDFRGPNCFNDQKYPYFKAGIYKRNWSTTTKRVVYMDEVRVGNSSATYNDVAPSGTASITPPVVVVPVTPPAPVSVAPVNLELINALTDLPIQPLTTGMTLDLATLPTSSLNVDAIAPVGIGSVVYSLTGAQTLQVTQSGAPYSLFGDVGGNFNVWTPALGEYTLTATSYSGAGGTGTAGTPTVVSFKVINSTSSTPPVVVTPPVVETPPAVVTPSATLAINNNAVSAATAQVTLNITAVNATQMRFLNAATNVWGAWEPVAATKAWTLPAGNGTKLVSMQVSDAAGVISAVASDEILLDIPVVTTPTTTTTTPSVTMVINNNATTTSSREVTLNITAVNAVQMRFYDNSNWTWSAWQTVSATKAWTLSAGDGSKWVKIQVKNAAGVMSATTFDAITLKTL